MPAHGCDSAVAELGRPGAIRRKFGSCVSDRAGRGRCLPASALPLFTALAPEGRICGYRAYARLAPRLPLLSPLIPILLLAPVRALGERIYARVAESRTCSLVPMNLAAPSRQTAAPSTALWCAGLSLLAVNIFCGSFHIVRSWPFACYPTFDRIQKAELHRLIASVDMKNGTHQEYELSHDPVMAKMFSAERWQGLTYRVEETPAGNCFRESASRAVGVVEGVSFDSGRGAISHLL